MFHQPAWAVGICSSGPLAEVVTIQNCQSVFLFELGLSHATSNLVIIMLLFILLVNGTIGDWGPGLYGHSDVYFAICSNSTFDASRKCSPAMNGGVPCQESLLGDLPKKSDFGSPYRCNCEIRHYDLITFVFN